MSGRVTTRVEGSIGWLVFDQPERHNAISVDMWRQLPGAVAGLQDDDQVRVVVLRGAGDRAFVAGADISEFEDERTGAAVDHYDRAVGSATLALGALDKPVLAMIHGHCIGGGVAVALGADLRYAADDASFAIPAAKLGLGYHPEGIERLLQLVGPAATKEIFFTGRRFGADEALRMGLVNAVVAQADLEGHVGQIAESIAANAPLTIRSVRRIVAELGRDPSKRDAEMMRDSVNACFASDDYREGIAAFLEKRPPRFRGG